MQIFVAIKHNISNTNENFITRNEYVGIYVIIVVSNMIGNICLILACDYLKTDGISRYAIFISGVCFAIGVIITNSLLNYPDEIKNAPELIVNRTLGESIILLFGVFSYFDALIRIYRKSPVELQKTSRYLLISSFFFLSIFIFSRESNLEISGLNELAGYGMVFNFLIILMKNPELLNVLSHKVIRLDIIQNKSGLALYSHYFTESDEENTLFPCLLHGLNLMTLDVFKQGKLQQIKFKHGYLLFSAQEQFSVGIVTIKPSKYLRNALEQFCIDFSKMFQQEILDLAIDVEKFMETEILIKKHFSLVQKKE
jgi:hypothetical protein